MQAYKIHTHLSKFRVSEGEPLNVTSQYGAQCNAGKWLVPTESYKPFLETIIDVITNKPAIQLHLLERPNKEYNQIKIDIDLRFKANAEEIKTRTNIYRRYDDNFIKATINVIVEIINQIIVVKDNYNIYVQEKTNPRILHENIIKDGIHILIPEIVMSNTALVYLRKKIIENSDIIQMISDIGNTTDIKSVFDETIISKNSWYIYGCGKPADEGIFYTVSKVFKIIKKQNDEYMIMKTQSNKTIRDYIYLFSNFGKQPNVEYVLDLEDAINEEEEETDNVMNKTDRMKMRNNFLRDKTNLRQTSELSATEIKTFLNCLKQDRADDYEEWRRIGLCLFNMDYRNYELWNVWSSKSDKYDESACYKIWYEDFKKFGKYNLGLNNLKTMAKEDNQIEYNKIINITKKNFMYKWIHEHVKETHIKSISPSTLSKFIKKYITDYATFNIACASPGSNPTWYTFYNHKWGEDKAAHKIYMLITEELELEFKKILEELKAKAFNQQLEEQNKTSKYSKPSNSPKTRNISINDGDGGDGYDGGGGGGGDGYDGGGGDGYGGDDNESILSYQNLLIDDREIDGNLEEQKNKYIESQHTKSCLDKCGKILDFISTPMKKKTIIEDLSQKCYEKDFYTTLDENLNVFVANNGVLDLEAGIFRNGEPSDMMTTSSNIDYPINVDSEESQNNLFMIQEWLNKIFPIYEVQDYVLSIFALKLSGARYGDKFHIFTGSGANGKSQFFKMIARVFGEYYRPFDNTLLNTAKRDPNAASPAIAVLKGCRIAATSEPKSGQPFESDKVKELVSGDELTGRHLNKDIIRFIPQYSMFMQCNDIPNNDSTDDGFWRKIFIIPCPSKFIFRSEDMYKTEDTVKYPYHFKAENQEHLYKQWAPYLLHMLFLRFLELKRNKFAINEPDIIKLALRNYKDEASPFIQFFNDKIEAKPGYKVDCNTVYAEFQLFAGRTNKVPKNVFIKQMERLMGIPKGRNKEYDNFRLFGTEGDLIEEIEIEIEYD